MTKQRKRGPLDDLRPRIRQVGFLDFEAWFAETPQAIGTTIRETLRDLARIYGDGVVGVWAARETLPRHVVEPMHTHLGDARTGPCFTLRLSELERSSLMAHVERSGHEIEVSLPSYGFDERLKCELEWRPKAWPGHPPSLRVTLSLGWTLHDQADAFRALVDGLMGRAAACGAILATAMPCPAFVPRYFPRLPPADLALPAMPPTGKWPHDLNATIRNGHIPGVA